MGRQVEGVMRGGVKGIRSPHGIEFGVPICGGQICGEEGGWVGRRLKSHE